LAQLLPLVEQGNLYNSINFRYIATLGDTLQVNLTAMSVHVASFLCPSDGLSEVDGYGRANYRFSTGPSPSHAAVANLPGSDTGAFSVFSYHRPADFRDGLSSTSAVSERLQGDWTIGSFRDGGDYYLGQFSTYQFNDPDAAIAACASLPRATPAESRGGESWFLSGLHFTTYNHVDRPNPRVAACVFDSTIEPIEMRTSHSGVMSATSLHAGGVNVLMMDGALRFVKDGVSLKTWRSLSTRNGGEMISDY
jgi:prepilin-type processing-associated H-X9-DG protein